MMLGKLKKQNKKSCYMGSFVISGNRSNISDQRPVVRHQLYKLPSFKEKTIRKSLVPLLFNVVWWEESEQMRQTGNGDQCPQFSWVGFSGFWWIFSCFLRFSLPSFTDHAESSRLALALLLLFKLAQLCSRQTGPLPLYSRYLECLSSNSR